MITTTKRLIGTALAVALLACGPQMEAANGDPTDADAAEPAAVQDASGPSEEDAPVTAVAVLRPTGGGEATGQVLFAAQGPDSVRVSTRTEGLTPGRHAHHVHRFGDCRAEDGSSAGPHLPFVDVPENADPDFITGNLGEVVMPGTGQQADVGTSESVVDLSAIGGLDGIIGRSVVVHRFDNDPSQPPGGDAGPRVACGVIGVADD